MRYAGYIIKRVSVTCQSGFYWLQGKRGLEGTMKSMPASAAEVKLVGGRLCLDFINTVDGRKSDPARTQSQLLGDKLGEYSDLVGWSRHSGIVTATQAERLIQASKRNAGEAKDVLERATALREALYRIFKAIMTGRRPQSVDLEIVNDELLEARTHERLTHGPNGFTWEWAGGETALDRMLWSIVQSGAEFLTTGDLSRLRECGGGDCGWLFEDTSKNRSRQWCDMQDCGNVAKVRRYRTRLRKSNKRLKA
jgi:predicted RNA-binding Zn ribbon-like protein